MHAGGSDQARFDARPGDPGTYGAGPRRRPVVAVGGQVREGGVVGSGDHGLDVAVQDLTTGKVTRHVLGGGQEATPVAWSPDGASLAVLIHQAPPNLRYDTEGSYPEVDRSGWIAVVDTSSGAVRRIEPEASWRPESAAFSPRRRTAGRPGRGGHGEHAHPR